LICIALVLWCSATSPAAAQLDLAIPVLVFCFFAVLPLTRLRISDNAGTVQPIALLSVQSSRAPPLA
jgi:hypothetical protein